MAEVCCRRKEGVRNEKSQDTKVETSVRYDSIEFFCQDFVLIIVTPVDKSPYASPVHR